MSSPDHPDYHGEPHHGWPHDAGSGWASSEPSPGGPRPGWEQRQHGSVRGNGPQGPGPGGPRRSAEEGPLPSIPIALPVWTRMDPAEARESWAVLRGWLAEIVFTRYDDLAEAIQPCWYRHAEAVEQLSWLCAAWRQAYLSAEASVSLAAEWHIRWAPSVRDRLKTVFKPCLRGHSTNPHDYRSTEQRVDDGELDAFIAADLTARASHTTSQPRPA